MSDWHRTGPGTWGRDVSTVLSVEIKADVNGWDVRVIDRGRPTIRLMVVGGRTYARQVAEQLAVEYQAAADGRVVDPLASRLAH